MNKNQKGKRAVVWIGVSCLLLAIAGLVAGIWVAVENSKSIAVQTTVGNVFGLVAGLILCLMSFGLIWVGIYFTWVGLSVKAFQGSIKDDDLAKGTVNMKKCSVCGSEVTAEDKVCGNCGKSLAKTKKCKNCGKEVEASKKHCTECGAEMTTRKQKEN